jgi:hypothetical protein
MTTMNDIMKELDSGRHGHFAAALANAWFLADSGNRTKIELSWGTLISNTRKLLETPQ